MLTPHFSCCSYLKGSHYINITLCNSCFSCSLWHLGQCFIMEVRLITLQTQLSVKIVPAVCWPDPPPRTLFPFTVRPPGPLLLGFMDSRLQMSAWSRNGLTWTMNSHQINWIFFLYVINQFQNFNRYHINNNYTKLKFVLLEILLRKMSKFTLVLPTNKMNLNIEMNIVTYFDVIHK